MDLLKRLDEPLWSVLLEEQSLMPQVGTWLSVVVVVTGELCRVYIELHLASL